MEGFFLLPAILTHMKACFLSVAELKCSSVFLCFGQKYFYVKDLHHICTVVHSTKWSEWSALHFSLCYLVEEYKPHPLYRMFGGLCMLDRQRTSVRLIPLARLGECIQKRRAHMWLILSLWNILCKTCVTKKSVYLYHVVFTVWESGHILHKIYNM